MAGGGLVLLLVLWTALYAIAWIISSILLYTQRNIQPIKFRGAGLVFMSSFGCFMLTASHCATFFRRAHGFNRERYCAVAAWIEWICYTMFLLPYYLRVARGIVIDRCVSKALDSRHGRSNGTTRDAYDSQTGGGGDWHDSRAVFSSLMEGNRERRTTPGDLIAWESRAAPRITEGTLLKTAFRAVFILAGIKVLIDAIIYFVMGHSFGVYSGDYCDESLLVRTGIYTLIHLVETCFLYAMVRTLKSGWMGGRFYRKQELGFFLTIWFMATLAMGIVSLWEWFQGLPLGSFQDICLGIMMVRNTFAFIISQIWVVVLSFDGALAQKHALPFSGCHSLTSLSSVLGDISCMQYFREYLISLSQVETLLCWMEIDLLRDAHPASAHLHATRIWDKYLAPTAALGVQVSDIALGQGRRRLNDLERESKGGGYFEGGVSTQEIVFDRVQQELFAQMKSVFSSFLTSPEGYACHERLERQEILQKALALCGMLQTSMIESANADMTDDSYADDYEEGLRAGDAKF